jgi:hypothetical protein
MLEKTQAPGQLMLAARHRVAVSATPELPSTCDTRLKGI